MDLSIIIPTLNEANYITHTLDKIEKRKSGRLAMEVILVDAGSADLTVELARPLVDKVLLKKECKGLKYKSLNEGANIATGNMLLFLDADSVVPQDFDRLIFVHLSDPDAVGGAFEFKIDGEGLVFRVIELINRLRYRLDRRYFGDQGVFCTKQAFDKIGGYPSEPIMEAAYFCKALSRQGRLSLVKTHLITSARRFQEGRPIQVFTKDAWIWVQYLLGLPIQRYALNYWKENEQRN